MAWQNGPLPPDTWNWGGVVPVGDVGDFYFADFRGDHVVAEDGSKDGKRIEAKDVACYDNSLTLPPTGGERIKGEK